MKGIPTGRPSIFKAPFIALLFPRVAPGSFYCTSPRCGVVLGSHRIVDTAVGIPPIHFVSEDYFRRRCLAHSGSICFDFLISHVNRLRGAPHTTGPLPHALLPPCLLLIGGGNMKTLATPIHISRYQNALGCPYAKVGQPRCNAAFGPLHLNYL